MQNATEIDPMVRTNPTLGCMFSVGGNAKLLDTVYEQIDTKSLELFGDTDQQDKAVADEIKLITKNICLIKDNFFSAFKSILKPSDYSLMCFQFFLNFIEDKVNRYKINYPDDRDFDHKWNDFKREIAFLRYDRDKNLYLRVENFLNYLNQKLESIDELKAQTEQENGIWAAWKQIFATPDALDFHVADLANKVHTMVQNKITFQGIRLSPPQLAKACDQMIKRLSHDLPWLFDELRNLLSPLISIQQHPIFNNSKYLLEYVEQHYPKFQKGFEQFHLEYLDLKNKDSLLKAENFYASILHFCGIEGTQLNEEGFGEISRTIKFNEIIEKYMELEKAENQYAGDHLYDLNDYFDTQIGNYQITNTLGSIEEKITLDQFKIFNECLRSFQKCHILIDAYLASPMNNLMEITNAFATWSLEASNYDYFKRSDQNKKSIEELFAEIEGPSSRKSKKTGRQRNQKAKKTPPSKKEEEKILPKPIEIVKISQERLPTIQNLVTGAAELSSSLKHLFSPHLSMHLKAALRQAIMFADDLQVIQNHSLANSAEVISTSYYLMEQLFRYLILSQDPSDSCDKHNLKALMKELPKEKLRDPSIAKTLYLGNYWASYPFEQYEGWCQLSEQEIPKPLKEIYDAMRSPTQVHTLPDYAEKTIAFSKSLVGPSTPLLNPILPFNSFCFDLKKWNLCIDQCEKGMSQLSLRPYHPALNVLKQACYGLKMLKGLFEKINHQGIRSDTLSFFVRRALYWQSHILESYLRAISLLQSGFDLEKHDLIKGYQQIDWMQKENHLNLIQEWMGVSKFSRYPFESPQAIHDTHRLILKGERLRESPEQGLGFLPSNKSVATPLNFIDIPPNGLKAEEILKELEGLCGRALAFIEKTAGPQIEKELERV